MSSYHQIIYHIIFGTKNRQPTLSEEHSKELFKYIWGIIKNKKCFLYRINGTEDHIHILCDLHPDCSLSDFVKTIKVSSSIWLKQSENFKLFNGWSEGYAAVTYSIKEKDIVIKYIKNQKEHHTKISFFDEYKKFLIENKIDFKEEYLMH